ncbi:MAG: hypothetical protein IJ695_04665 [Butyrivibrio sp.]|nr:hypothetical protein [Butyrivibrio sp.]
MISITEIVLIVAGFAAIILGYLLPAGKELDEEERLLMEKEIRELVRREVEGCKDTIDDMVSDSIENSLDRSERAMERLSNEKISAIGEYSDTVINDIHKNHDEVMFMYDMLNDKHKNLTSVVSEVTKKADEARQAVRDAEATAREAKIQTLPRQENVLPKPAPADNVRAVLLDKNDDKLSGIRIPYKGKETAPVNAPATPTLNAPAGSPANAAINAPLQQHVMQAVSPKPVSPIAKEAAPAQMQNINKSGYFDEKNLEELKGMEEIPAEVLSKEAIASSHVIGSESAAAQMPSKVVPITEAVRVEGRMKNPDTSMKELTANDPISQNKQIIEMHKAGKSNMVIARELGLGIGEVKLVIDLSNKHRKVR